MINLENLRTEGVPTEILTSLYDLQRDIELLEYMPKGANGYVIFGRNRITGVNIAIKYYYYGTDYHEEVKLLSGIENDNIIKVLDARTIENGYAYFLTHKMTHGDIDNAISNGLLTFRESIEVVKGILNGLVVLHSSRPILLHRDLKPANILISEKKNPIIADFGSVKVLPEGNEYINPSQHTALYRPPESYGENKYYVSSDIYQVGLVMYQLLKGNLPYDAFYWFSERDKRQYQSIEDDYDRSRFIDDILYRKANAGKLIDVLTIPKYVSPNVINIIKTALRPDYTKRYPSCSLFLLALHRLRNIPNWLEDGDLVKLIDFKGIDYRVVPNRGIYRIEKKRFTSHSWRRDNSFGSGSKDEMIALLRNGLNA